MSVKQIVGQVMVEECSYTYARTHHADDLVLQHFLCESYSSLRSTSASRLTGTEVLSDSITLSLRDEVMAYRRTPGLLDHHHLE